MRSAASVTSYGAPCSVAIDSGVNQSACGPGVTRNTLRKTKPSITRRVAANAPQRRARRGADLEPVPFPKRAAVDSADPARQMRRGAAEHGGTRTPPRMQSTQRAPDRVAPAATTSPAASAVAVQSGADAPKSDPQSAITAGASVRNVPPRSVISIAGAPSGLPTSRLPMRSDVGSAAPHAETPSAPKPARPRSCTVDSIPGSMTASATSGFAHALGEGVGRLSLERGATLRSVRFASVGLFPGGSVISASSDAGIGTKRTRSPRGAEPEDRGRRGRARAACDRDPPAARSGERVDPGLAAADRDAARGDSRPRTREPRRRERLRQPVEVGKPGTTEELTTTTPRRGSARRRLASGRGAGRPPRGPVRRRAS